MACKFMHLFAAALYLGLAVSSVIGARDIPLSASKEVADDAAEAPAPAAIEGTCKSLVETYGYDCEEHMVTTEDGYMLSMQRIPDGLSKTGGSKQPVLLQHGLLMDGVTWLLNSPEESLAYILADAGFDVWIANSRGTKWSRGHVSLSPDDSAYWDWSWDELVAYDLPATFQYVYNQTGQQMYYVGHSLGTLIALASFSQLKLLDQIKAAALLSPIAHVSQMTSPIASTAAKDFFAETYYWLGLDEFDPKGAAATKLLKTICKDPDIDCYNLMTAFTGQNCCLNSSTVDTFLEYEPQSTATKNMVHLAQMIRNGGIAMYDYGNDNNQHYGQPNPPTYNMSNIPNDLPLFFSYGGKDELADVDDINLLFQDLSSHEGDKLTTQYRDDYAHADFVMATNANEVVYNPLIGFFKLN